MAYSAIDPSAKDAESPVNVDLIEKLDTNPQGMFAGDPGAPRLQDSAINVNTINGNKLINGTVTQDKLEINSVGTGELKESTWNASEFVSGVVVYGGSGTVEDRTRYTSAFISAAGQYGFDPRAFVTEYSSPFGDSVESYGVSSAAKPQAATGNSASLIPLIGIPSRAYKAHILAPHNYGTQYNVRMNISQVFISSSPPVDFGDGEAEHFYYALIRNDEVLSTWSANVPPWLYNGPNSVVSDLKIPGKNKRKTVKTLNKETGEVSEQVIEIDQSVKNADMPLIPHPFLSKEENDTIILLDPCEAGSIADIEKAGESIPELIRDGFIKIDNTPLNRAAIPGVMQVDFKWKNTNKKPMGMKKNKA